MDKNKHETVFTHEVMGFGKGSPQAVVRFSADSTVNYVSEPNRYKLNVIPDSRLGYFSFFNAILNMGIAIAILGLFRKIFRESNLADSFKESVYKRLIILAVLFALSDMITFINYFIFNNLLRKSIQVPDFELITDVGHGLMIGLVIYAIAIIYQRGLSLQQENELTV